MIQIIFARLGQMVFVIFMLTIITFSLMKLAPGDPIWTMLQVDEVIITFEEKESLREELLFDQPILIQYGNWLKNIVRLDLGKSFVSQQPVTKEIGSRIMPTLFLTMGGLAVMMGIALLLGSLAAIYQNRWIDHLSRLLAFAGASVPTFWLGLIMIYLFSVKFAILPALEHGGIKSLILPSFTLGLGLAAVYARLLRAGLLESYSQEYIRAARARGIGEWQILRVHALRSALVPVITMFGMSFGSLLGGSVVVEVLFSYPGLGKLVVDAVFKRDYPLIQGYVLFTGVVVVFVNLIVDLSYRFLDPRIRYGKGGH
ncbi:nickel ABC transporter permease [Anaerobacillus sp. CMMVII]|uniref:nickel ABC transporter permease n=1 Tax=Anaerobacillus sp. CMMVII TaxID=2755588 RepID=UPI0037BE4957